LRSQNAVDTQYLRWKHEATVVDVVERLDGVYVLTFETGKIGLNWHTVGNLTDNPVDGIFVGYLPKADVEPANLDAMLDESKILRTEEAVSFDLVFGVPAEGEPGEEVPSYAFTDRRIRGYRIASVMLRSDWRLRKLRRRRRKTRRKSAGAQAVAPVDPTPLHAPLSERGESKEPLPIPPVQAPVGSASKPKKPRKGGS
jgi:hypothetical protein